MHNAKQSNESRISRAAAIVVGAALLLMGPTASAQVSLGTASSFGLLGGSAVTNTGSSVVQGNLGVSPGSAVTGFPPGVVTPPGSIHAADAVAAQAQTDATAAFITLFNTPTQVDLTGTDLGGLVLTPGVYNFNSSAQLTGTLTLNAQGNPNAVFIFKIGTTLTTASGSAVVITNGGSSCNVFWGVGSSATFGTTTSFAGTVLAAISVTMTTGATLSGRALALSGATTLAGGTITTCAAPPPPVCPTLSLSPSTLPPGSLGSAYNQTVAASGGTGPYTYSVSSGALPTGLALNPTSGALTGTLSAAGTFNFNITATDVNGCPVVMGYALTIAAVPPICPTLTLGPATLQPGTTGVPYSQTISVSGGVAPYTFNRSSGTLPSGLALNPATGALVGTPTSAGSFSFVIAATDANGCPGVLGYTVTIAAAPLPPAGVAAIPTLSSWGLVGLLVLMGATVIMYLRRRR